jgi:diguanylate cyclase (GGDEF)-like protein
VETDQQTERVPGILSRLASLRRRKSDPYAGADQANACRAVAGLWVLSGVLSLAFLPLDPPDAAIGDAGWVIAGVIVAGSFAGPVWLIRRKRPVPFDGLLLISYFGMVGIGVLQWLAGGVGPDYEELYFLWIASAMGVHPPARALTFLMVAGLAAFAPLGYDGWSDTDGRALVTDYLLWGGVGFALLGLMTHVRAQRVRLQAGEEEAQRLARADALTGLGNRRAFDEALGAEIARARRADSTMSVALVDLDEFKHLNDRFGHLEGDRCLKQVTDAMNTTLRGGDRAFRWGGDEFALLLPDTSYEGAEEAMSRVASVVMNTCSAPDGRSLTVSWGIAELEEGLGASGLFDQADLALMAHKRRKTAAVHAESVPGAPDH